MKRVTKNRKLSFEKLDLDKIYSLDEASELVKDITTTKFDASVDLAIRLGVDPKNANEMIRGVVSLPHGTGKNVRVVVFAQGDAAKAATDAGADHVGFEDLIKKVQDGFTDFDAAVATPDAMGEVRKIARVLGPRGLMPNPKTGTVTDDTAAAVNAVKAGKVDYKLDKNANISAAIGKASFSEGQLTENAEALIESVIKAKPASAKGNYIENITIAATMLPGLKLENTAAITE